MHTPRWIENLAINACAHLEMDYVPRIVCRRSKQENSSGLAYYWGKDKCINICLGTSRVDAKLVILHEIAHMARPPKRIKVPYKMWYEARRTICREKHLVIAPFNPKLQNRVVTTKYIAHTPEFWDTAWELYRWAKLPIKYCQESEFNYRKGAIAAYHRSRTKAT